MGDECDSIYLVLSGVIEITLSNGHREGREHKEQHLDLLGRGSLIGMANILHGDKWPYHATARSEG